MSVSTVTQRPSSGSAVLAAVCLAAVILPLSFSAGAIATPAIGRAHCSRLRRRLAAAGAG